jgi:hypothetical protein
MALTGVLAGLTGLALGRFRARYGDEETGGAGDSPMSPQALTE